MEAQLTALLYRLTEPHGVPPPPSYWPAARIQESKAPGALSLRAERRPHERKHARKQASTHARKHKSGQTVARHVITIYHPRPRPLCMCMHTLTITTACGRKQNHHHHHNNLTLMLRLSLSSARPPALAPARPASCAPCRRHHHHHHHHRLPLRVAASPSGLAEVRLPRGTVGVRGALLREHDKQ
jgi:hypothetical protein